jgi:hypothetical protein
MACVSCARKQLAGSLGAFAASEQQTSPFGPSFFIGIAVGAVLAQVVLAVLRRRKKGRKK